MMSSMRNGLILITVLFLQATPKAQTGGITHTVINFGNLADVRDAGHYAQALDALLDDLEQRHTILFNGDILREDVNFRDALASLDTVIAILDRPGQRRLVFIPGDRDWDDSGALGWEHAKLLEDHIHGLDKPDVLWPLNGGCPGPEVVPLGLSLKMVVVNTQWWNHPYAKPSPSSVDCDLSTHELVIEELKDRIEESRYGNLIVAGHYPVVSNGIYGGRFPFHKWAFPVPVVSTMITAFKQNVGSSYDISNEHYTEFREEMEDILKEYASLIYMSGHDHTQEILTYDNNVVMNSGAPEDHGFLMKSPETLYAGRKPGLSMVHYGSDGDVWVAVYAYDGQAFTKVSEQRVFQAPCMTPVGRMPVNERLVPCLEDKYVLPEMSDPLPPPTQVIANPHYAAKKAKVTFLGQHYRDAWTTPVTVPYLDLDRAHGGLVPYQLGGGRQTSSLKMVGEDGREYVFRSVDKDPSKALSYSWRETLISLVVRDQTTTQHPYGAVVASRLLDDTHILHARPVIRLMPDDAKLGPFQSQFGNMLGMVEERPTGRGEVRVLFADADEIRSSNSMFRQLYKDRDNAVAQEEFAQARMFDILVGDWGKHEDNWKWAGYNESKGEYYRPIPRDRDHVFSRWDGVLPWLVDREWAKPSGENFDYRIKGLRSLTWQARHLDRFVANELTREDWINAAQYIRQQLPDALIDTAIHALPAAVEPIDGPDIAGKLKQRRDDLDTYADRFYDMLAREVDVIGSVKNELFEVTRNADGSVLVEMYKIKQGEKDKLFYSRTFIPDETDEIRLFGLEGQDRYEIGGNARKSIKVRVIPGPGIDHIVDTSQVSRGGKSTHVYDLTRTDVISDGSEIKMVHIPFQDAYRYRRTAFTYNTYMPYALLFFSSGNGVALSGGVVFVNQSYNKPDFSSRYNISARVSSLGNFRMGLDATWRHVVGAWDLTFRTAAEERKRFNYFFGIGNETDIDQDLIRDDYYTLQYSKVYGEVGLLREFWKRSSVELFIDVSSNGGDKTENTILADLPYEVRGVEPQHIGKAYLRTELDFRDAPTLPTRGMRFYFEGYVGQVLNEDPDDYSMAKGTLESFFTIRPVTVGLKAGGVVHGGIPPYYDMQYLGQNTHLRGYRQNRFTGQRALFFNSDLRIRLIDKDDALIPHEIGLTLFGDVGRVYEKDVVSDKWHLGYGVGIYVVPIHERLSFQVSASFSEEETGLVRLSFGQTF